MSILRNFDNKLSHFDLKGRTQVLRTTVVRAKKSWKFRAINQWHSGAAALLICFSVQKIPLASAADDGAQAVPHFAGLTTREPIPECRKFNLHGVKPGFRCRTSIGSVFERVVRENFKEAWKGPDGLIWSDYIGVYTQPDGIKICTTLGGELPLRTDFERGELDHFSEVLPTITEKWFWTQSFRSRSPDMAFYYTNNEGDGGKIEVALTTIPLSIRCISR